jgi:hypothetical protein
VPCLGEGCGRGRGRGRGREAFARRRESLARGRDHGAEDRKQLLVSIRTLCEAPGSRHCLASYLPSRRNDVHRAGIVFVYHTVGRHCACASRGHRSRSRPCSPCPFRCLPLQLFGRASNSRRRHRQSPSPVHIHVHVSIAQSSSRRILASIPINPQTKRPATMVPKPQGQAVTSVTHRPLPPLPKLRVRRPNKPETNPCLGAMSSVLGTYEFLGGQDMTLLWKTHDEEPRRRGIWIRCKTHADWA